MALATLTLRAVYLQLVESRRLGALATDQHRVPRVLPAPRGALLDRSNRALAISQPAVALYAYTHLVDDPQALARELAPLIKVPVERLRDRLADRGHQYVLVARQLEPAVRKRVEARKLGGGALAFERDERRSYPQGDVGAQIVGLAGVDGEGIAGAELSLERLLAARPGREVVLQDLDQNVLRVLSRQPAVPGRTVRLTLDRDLQESVQRVVAETRLRWKARAATAVVLDPRTGGILAMASAPGIPLGGYAEATVTQQRIRAITDQYEPGSTFKVVTVGAALEEGLVTPRTPFVLRNQITLYDKTVTEAHPRDEAEATLTVTDIVRDSSNVGTITLAREELGEPTFRSWLDRLGFGEPTGVDLPGEIRGSFSKWSGTSILNMPIGIGVAVTPLQLAGLYGAIANGGVWRQPHVVDRVFGGGAPRWRERRLFSPGTARALGAMLTAVVRSGTGQQAQIPGYTVAGKTGTTQKVDPKTGQYCGEKCGLYFSSFVGYVPATRPRAVILVMVDEPDFEDAYYGSDVAAPAFREIARDALRVLGVPPDGADGGG